MLKYEGAGTIQAWFLGTSPELEFRAPALVLREDPVGVFDAARVFLAHG
jgi:hypothetical protein